MTKYIGNQTLDIIIAFIEAIKENNCRVESIDERGNKCVISNAEYLLGQMLRQYEIPKSHHFISQKAKELWVSITDEHIENYCYTNRVICTKDEPVEVELYKGSAKIPYAKKILKKGDSFRYREVFHDEHMITIHDIIEALKNIEELNYSSVQEVLNSIYICRVLKSEDRRLTPKKKRGLDINWIKENVYKINEENGVKILDV